jgi:hypothetical protein
MNLLEYVVCIREASEITLDERGFFGRMGQKTFRVSYSDFLRSRLRR